MSTREIRCAIEVREDDTRQSPGRLVGTLIEYETRAKDRAELFREGALSWPDDGVVLNRQHARDRPVMRFTPVAGDGVVRVDAALPDTQAGRDLATEVRSGLFTGLSVEFRAKRETRQGGVRVIEAAELVGAAVVDTSSYDTSVAVRERRQGGRRRAWL